MDKQDSNKISLTLDPSAVSSSSSSGSSSTFGRLKIGRASFRYPKQKRQQQNKQKPDNEQDVDDDGTSRKFQRSMSHSDVDSSSSKNNKTENRPQGNKVAPAADNNNSSNNLKNQHQQQPPVKFQRVSLTPSVMVTTDADSPHVVSKVMLLGDSGVGKTCLLVQYKDGKFLAGNFIATVGIDFRNKEVEVDGKKVKLQIWDTAGQERFRSVTHAYYRDAQALLLLYDVTNRQSFFNVRSWLAEVKENARHNVVVVLIGNKCDVRFQREVKTHEGEALAKEYNVPFIETSAKTGHNVDFAFQAVVK
ncbi:unnamed protein product [Notodromas monacha]|uniref:Uncharacterized protein n=1 Tax=Notodromas monacha TaxID=399045 RepID=A0A7R9C0D3_9CRUS|nr:unnamed protein product [Notodromas monacha]CAG0923990.1 unnamed protein product [Notodromas monacha]